MNGMNDVDISYIMYIMGVYVCLPVAVKGEGYAVAAAEGDSRCSLRRRYRSLRSR